MPDMQYVPAGGVDFSDSDYGEAGESSWWSRCNGMLCVDLVGGCLVGTLGLIASACNGCCTNLNC